MKLHFETLGGGNFVSVKSALTPLVTPLRNKRTLSALPPHAVIPEIYKKVCGVPFAVIFRLTGVHTYTRFLK